MGIASPLQSSEVAPANQTKERSVHELFAGAFRNKSSICESRLFSQGKTPEFTKTGEIHELFVLALFLVWFAGATPEVMNFLTTEFPAIKLNAPRCGSGPNCPLEGPPPPSKQNWRTLSLKPQPFPPHLLPPLPPTPLGLFAMLREGAPYAGVGWGPPSGTCGQTHIWGHSIESPATKIGEKLHCPDCGISQHKAKQKKEQTCRQMPASTFHRVPLSSL